MVKLMPFLFRVKILSGSQFHRHLKIIRFLSCFLLGREMSCDGIRYVEIIIFCAWSELKFIEACSRLIFLLCAR